MRIISQDGMIDVPYEDVCVNIDYRNRCDITVEGVHGGESHIVVAIYLIAEKAIRAMKMLRSHYRERVKEESYHNGFCDHLYFQFPQDGEVEV